MKKHYLSILWVASMVISLLVVTASSCASGASKKTDTETYGNE